MMKHSKRSFIIGLAVIFMMPGLAFGSGSEKYGSGVYSEGMTSETTAIEQTGSLSLNSDQVMEMQNLLRVRGYDVGAADGMLSNQTSDAISKYQADQKLTITGTPTPETVRALAPNAEQQEFFGLSPEFGEYEGMMEEK